MSLTVRRTWPRPSKDWSVFDDNAPIGYIYNDDTAQMAESRWCWALDTMARKAYRIGFRATGHSATFHDAKAEFRGAYERYLSWKELTR
jgi:hypothetical protein